MNQYTLIYSVETEAIKMTENWKDFPIEEFEERYQISDKGRLRNKQTNKVLKQSTTNGYIQCSLHSTNGKTVTMATNRAVALAFIPTDDTSLYVNHIDHNKLNNCVDNLEWIDQKENIRQAGALGRIKRHNKKVVRIGNNGDPDVVYNSTTEAAKAHEVDRTTVSAALRGKNPTAAGFRWKYFDEIKVEEFNTEDFVEISDYPNYMVSNKGQIYSKTFRRLLKPVKNANGYLYISLCNVDYKPAKRNWYVHQLVAQLFLDEIDGKDQVNHINKIKTDNNVENLEFVSASENMIHAKKT
jgi:hypothetical protein